MTPELPSRERVEKEREKWDKTVDAEQRIKEVVLTQNQNQGLSAKEVADRARCSTSTARKYLRQMSGEYVIEVKEGNSKKYYPNQEYLRWRKTFELASERTIDELREKIRETQEEIERLKDKYGSSSPEGIRISELESHNEIHKAIEDKAYWRSSLRQIDILKDAIDMAERLERYPRILNDEGDQPRRSQSH